MKRIVAMLVLVLCFGLVACKSKDNFVANKNGNQNVEQSQEKPSEVDGSENVNVDQVVADVTFVLGYLCENYDHYAESISVYLEYGVDKLVPHLSKEDCANLGAYALEVKRAIEDGYDFSIKDGFVSGPEEVVDQIDEILYKERYAQLVEKNKNNKI